MSKVYEKLQEKYGDYVVPDPSEYGNMKVVSTGSVSLDFATGLGGIPLGRIVQVYGVQSVGKTSLSFYMIAEHLNRFPDRDAYFLDIERTFDINWARKLRPDADWDRCRLIKPSPGMESVHIARDIAASGEASIIVYDSLGAMLDDSELNFDKKEGPKPRVGRAATTITFLVQQLAEPCDQNGTTAVLINQARDDINSMGFSSFHAPGGRSVGMASSLIFKMNRGAGNTSSFKVKLPGPDNKPKDIEVGYRTVIQVEKNKAGTPKNIAYYNFYNRPLNFLGDTKVELDANGVVGIDTQQEILDLALNWGVFEAGGGGYYSHPVFPADAKGSHRIRGRENVFTYLRENPDAKEEIRLELMRLGQNLGAKNE